MTKLGAHPEYQLYLDEAMALWINLGRALGQPVGAAPAAPAVDAPWGDLKVAFDFDDDPDVLWAGSDAGDVIFPNGWRLVETDGNGARTVAVFRVDHPPTVTEGRAVQAVLAAARAKEGGAA
ncbi:hypothetical protein [Delftia sp.]|uniref:hypothetical protein n=1 Tax=Delftia sp. TaxID=1886637 RepID=UPI00259D2202|nr:hypothetical protein [Delftia sp.]